MVSVRGILSHGGLRKDNPDIKGITGFYRSPGIAGRVVNLRLKGPSLFWGRARAEALVLWRSYDKAGRWNLWKHMATAHRALLEA